MKIYVAHRYSCNGEVLEVLSSIGRAIQIGNELARKGHFPYVPHLDCLMAIQDNKKIPVSWYYENSMAWLKCCDAIFIVDPNDIDQSSGVKAEFDYAVSKGYTVYYYTNEISSVRRKNYD